MFKPFTPLTLNRKKTSDSTDGEEDKSGPEAKRQRLDYNGSSVSTSIGPPNGIKRLASQPGIRKPLLTVNNSTPSETSKGPAPIIPKPSLDTGGRYNVLWRKYTTKKNKTWDGDGILIVGKGSAVLKDMEGKEIGRGFFNRKLAPGDQISIGGKEIEVDSELRGVGDGGDGPGLPPIQSRSVPQPPLIKNLASGPKKQLFKPPSMKGASTVLPVTNPEIPTPRHDPKGPNAFVLPRPPADWTKKTVVDVVVDPFVAQHLRPHQKEGVRFMYQSVMGMKEHCGEGCILADEMGLGKTLQTITLLWTLLKQNPIWKEKPVVRRALVVCPVTLMSNWRKEFKKWLGDERIGVFVADSKSNLRDFTAGKCYQVMIVGYERLQKIQGELQKIDIDIVVADEGHRLKGEKNKAAQAIASLSTSRRVILSGTPLQNDLHEFFVMVDFVNNGVLGSYNAFKREFENPIVKSRQPGASKGEKEKGEARSEELARLTSQFILRRTAEILSKYLPPKTEWVLCCKPTKVQLELYDRMLASAAATALGNPQVSLQLINILKKLCNSPALLNLKTEDEEEMLEIAATAQLVNTNPIKTSGKLAFLDRFLFALYNKTDEKIVLVSNYTATLDLLQNLLTARKYSFHRLDGTTPPGKRQQLVDQFNRTTKDDSFAFLLSAKAGGVGLNLIGASRLVLVDSDWNPAIDAQAMARVHRDGQRREVQIYRLLTAGCIDERIFQRQLTKQGLADSVLDQKATAQSFTQAELRDLFSLDHSLALSSESCLTHDLMGCTCSGNGEVPAEAQDSPSDDEDSDAEFPELDQLMTGREYEKQAAKILAHDEKMKKKDGKLGALKGWAHIKGINVKKKVNEDDPEPVMLEDDILQRVCGVANDFVGFMFYRKTG